MDKFYFPETERTYTSEGYLVVPATISRPGTQLYKAIELVNSIDALPNYMKPNDPVVVYRPAEEVFKVESVDSFKNIAVTNNHPPEFLNSKNYRKYSVGIVLSDVSIDESHVHGTLKVTDYDTINEIKDGKVDVSAGYHSNIVFEEGITPEGEAYQAIQRDITGNHVAIVARGRAGSEVKLADGLDRPSERGETLVAEGITNQSTSEASEAFGEGRRAPKGGDDDEDELGADGVPGSNLANPFGDSKETNSTVVEDEKTNIEELTMELKDAMTKIGELTKANEDLSSKILDQAGIDTLVEDRMQLIDACSRLHKGMEYMGKSNLELKKEVLLNKMPKVDLTDKSTDYVNAAFDVLKEAITDSVEGKHDPDVYGEDLALKDGDQEVPKPAEGEEKPAEVTKNVHEGENPDESENEAEEDEPDTEVKVSDSVSVLDSAFETEIKTKNNSKGISAYDKYCKESREAWKK